MRKPPFALLVSALLAFLAIVVPMRVVLHAAITVTEVMTGGFGAGTGTTSNLTTYPTGDALTTASNTVALCFIINTDADAPEDLSSVTAGAVSFTKADTTTVNAVTRLSAWYATSAVTATAITVNIAGGADNQTGLSINCYEVAGASISSPIIQTKVGASATTTTHTVTYTGARTSNSARAP